MPSAARVSDLSTHGGTVTGPGVATVLIGGMPAAVLGDMHLCSLPVSVAHPLVSSPFILGSGTVLIGGRPALRAGDACACGAAPAVGLPTVQIGG
ncbi:MAG: PAAR domain-containing protein [Vitreoscilla sp.]|nr:PAAR domain-containing protein [Vitreoscilla sp.]